MARASGRRLANPPLGEKNPQKATDIFVGQTMQHLEITGFLAISKPQTLQFSMAQQNQLVSSM